MLSLCGARLGTGSIPGFDINNNVMSERIDHGGFHLIIASCAVFAPGGARLGTACIFCFDIDNNIMPKRGNQLLRLQNRIAARAVLAGRKPCLGAGWLHGSIRDRIMPERRNGFLRLENLAAYGAMLPLGQPVFGTCRRNCRINYRHMLMR